MAKLTEEYPQGFDQHEFQSLKSFKNKIAYCNKHLKRIGSGSSRIAYQIDDKTVLKLAKNSKGLAQNELEISSVNDSFYGSIFAKVFEYDENNQWLEMELATKVTESNFKQAVGYDYKKFCYQLLDSVSNITRKDYRGYFDEKDAPNEYEKSKMFDDEENFFNDVVDYVVTMKIPPRELTAITAWGLVKRNGYDSIVLVDYGFNEDIAKNHYGFK